MSRIGRTPIDHPRRRRPLQIADGNVVTVKGPKGTLTETIQPHHDHCSGERRADTSPAPTMLKENRALHGLTRTLLHNMVVGVTEGFKKELEVNGVGYRAGQAGQADSVMNLGYLPSGLRGRD